MAKFDIDDDGIRMFGLVLIVAIILILLSTCVINSDNGNNGNDCPEGTKYLKKYNCCSIDDITCFSPPGDCIEVPCADEKVCCKPDVCEIQPNGTERCLPCTLDSPCHEIELPCCKEKFCWKGFCEECQNYPCNSEEDCCPEYECYEKECKNCKRPCKSKKDCCNDWECTFSECKDCDRVCAIDDECCDEDTCSKETGKCEGCKEGAYCSLDKPCCPGFTCNLDTNECNPCVNKYCETKKDCCPKDECNLLTNKCQSTDNCKGLPCYDVGKYCEICEGDNCETCLDNSVCASYGGMLLCLNSGNCGEGKVLCSEINKDYLGCICCDAVTGECAEDKKVQCSDIDNCEVCSCLEPYDVVVCPKDTYYCKDKGCAKQSFFTKTMGGYDILFDTCYSCSMDSKACCTYLIPSDAVQMADVTQVKLSECFSGYKYKDGKCILVTSYTENEGIYTYYFSSFDGNNIYTGSSKIGPSEVVVSTVRIVKEQYCNLDDSVFSAPLLYRVGG